MQVAKCVADGEGEAEEVLNRETMLDLKRSRNRKMGILESIAFNQDV